MLVCVIASFVSKERAKIQSFAKTAKKYHIPVSLDGCHMEADKSLSRKLAAQADILIMNRRYPTMVSEKENLEEALAYWKSAGLLRDTDKENADATAEGKPKRHVIAREKRASRVEVAMRAYESKEIALVLNQAEMKFARPQIS